jgi:hypothetical protein
VESFIGSIRLRGSEKMRSPSTCGSSGFLGEDGDPSVEANRGWAAGYQLPIPEAGWTHLSGAYAVQVSLPREKPVAFEADRI